VASYGQERQAVVEAGRRLWQRSYVAANDGNISVLIGDRLLVTPTGRSKGFLDEDDIVVVGLDGARLEGRLEPTSELGMHLAVYAARDDVRAVVHAHPPAATAFAVSGAPLDGALLPEVVVSLGAVPTVPYGTPSTPELADAMAPFLEGHNALILENHGAVAFGTSVDEAYYRLETVEHAAHIAILARALGGGRALPDRELKKLRELDAG
jgi:L-fuculose-phosphate aldolase